MRGFFSTKCSDMTIGQTLGFTALVTMLSFLPLVGTLVYEKISERRWTSSEDD